MAFMATGAEHVEQGEIVEIGSTGLCAVRDTEGRLRIVPTEQANLTGEILPLALTLLSAPDSSEAALEYLAHMTAKDAASRARNRLSASKPRASRLPAEADERIMELITGLRETRPSMSASGIAELVMDRLATEGLPVPSKKTILRRMKKVGH
ncbi:hypothetical protein SAMN04488026_105417 [Aliiruegeria lutimaris]|uniref:Uncharacterized protein n=2 Tax=Aliiruegeria lutimaris TaxID=571298 RepID=A0A1G9ET21_9RHOB|nr:hypothetical protein SAMN04488026_105417 [Aliiruegeria lutimaris]